MSRETAWSNWNEWKHCKKLFFSNDNSEISKAIDFVKMWKARIRTGSMPVSIDLTSILFGAKIQLDGSNLENEQQALLCGAMALVRFVNGITDQFQTGFYAQPVQNIADKIDIPEWMVEMRHEITHGQIPSVDLVYKGLMFSLNWLFDNYWQETAYKIEDQNKTFQKSVIELLNQYTDLVFESVANIKVEASSETKKEKKKANKNERDREIVIQNLLKIVNHGNLSVFVEYLSKCNSFVLENHKQLELSLPTSVNMELDDTGFQAIDTLAELWKPFFLPFQERFKHINELLLQNLSDNAKNSGHLISTLLAAHILSSNITTTNTIIFVVSLLLKNPSILSFQILSKIILSVEVINTEMKELLEVFLSTFESTVHFLNKKLPGVMVDKTHVFTDVISKLTGVEEPKKSNPKSGNKKKWTWLSDQEFQELPPIGEFKSGNTYQNLNTQSRICKVHYIDDVSVQHMKTEAIKNYYNPEIADVIESLFDKNGHVFVYDDDSDSESCPTEGYTEDAEMSWFADEERPEPNKVDFEIEGDSADQKNGILKSHNLYANTVDVSKLILF